MLKAIILVLSLLIPHEALSKEPLVAKQIFFTRKLTRLMYHAELAGERDGFFVVLGETFRNPECKIGHEDSTHYYKLSAHLLVFTTDLQYPHPDHIKIHNELHDMWEFLGGSKRIEGDLIHYSIEHNGVR